MEGKTGKRGRHTRGKPNSTSGIYFTAVKVAQCRQVATNRREMEEAKQMTAKKIATRKVHLQLKRYEAFDMCINSMNSLSLSTSDKDRFIKLIQKSSNTIKDDFLHVGRKLAELPNKGRYTLAR